MKYVEVLASKNDGNVFECQAYGIQHSKDEPIKLLTKVDVFSATATFSVSNNAPIPSARTEGWDDCVAIADTQKVRFY